MGLARCIKGPSRRRSVSRTAEEASVRARGPTTYISALVSATRQLESTDRIPIDLGNKTDRLTDTNRHPARPHARRTHLTTITVARTSAGISRPAGVQLLRRSESIARRPVRNRPAGITARSFRRQHLCRFNSSCCLPLKP